MARIKAGHVFVGLRLDFGSDGVAPGAWNRKIGEIGKEEVGCFPTFPPFLFKAVGLGRHRARHGVVEIHQPEPVATRMISVSVHSARGRMAVSSPRHMTPMVSQRPSSSGR